MTGYVSIWKPENGKSETMSNKQYDKNYYEKIGVGSARSAAEVIPVVLQFIKPGSVADVGCGTGLWLKEWQKSGVTSLLGIDGSYITASQFQADPSCFMSGDLEQPIMTNMKYDLVQSLEVAEHIRTEFAETFIQNLCRLGNIILFSASIPEQGGVNHFNEHYPDYWIALFKKFNYHPYDIIRPIIWNNTKIDTCYRQNMLLFIKDGEENNYPHIKTKGNAVMNLVHPETYELKNRIIRDYQAILRSPFHALWYLFKKYIKLLLTKIGLWQ